MLKTAVVRARVNEIEKNRFEHLCDMLEVSVSTAINILMKKAVQEKALPGISVPNDETIKAIKESRAGIGVSKFASFEEMMKDLNS